MAVDRMKKRTLRTKKTKSKKLYSHFETTERMKQAIK